MGRWNVAWTWRLLQAGREVGRIVLHDDGRVEARGPDGFPESERRAIEEGRASFREFGWSDRPRPGLDALPDVWWAVPVLVLAAAQNAVLEVVVVVGYLMTRLRQLGNTLPVVIAASAILRGSYHLYQGIGAFVGNAVMGVVFALFFLRTKRVMPLVVAHTLLDIVAFVGYALLKDHLPGWL